MMLKFVGKDLLIKYILGLEGVCGCNFNNEFIKEKFGWASFVKFADGLKVTFEWILSKIVEEKVKGVDIVVVFGKFIICGM